MTGLETRVFDVYGDDTAVYPVTATTPPWVRIGPDWRSGVGAAGEATNCLWCSARPGSSPPPRRIQ